MDRRQMENIYIANELTDYRLETLEDVLKVHGIDYKKINGYQTLSNVHKEEFKSFLIHYMNGLGLDSRMRFVPLGIHYVDQIVYSTKEDDEDGPYFIEVGRDIIDKSNDKMYKTYRSEGYEEATVFDDEVKETILRIDFKEAPYYEGDTGERWLHIIKDGTQWY